MITVTHNNPIAPATAPSADDMINAVQANHSANRGQAQQTATTDGYNPYRPVEDTQQGQQQAHASNIEQFLSPIAHNEYDINDAHTPEMAKAFTDNIANDPAWNELGDEMHDVLEPLRQGIMSGQIDINQAKQIFSKWGVERFDPVMEKHHGIHSQSHKIHLHDTSWIQQEAK